MLKEAWTVAIETLSWMQMRRLSERLALEKTAQQLGINNYDALRLAHMLVCETTKKQNFIDAFINHALQPENLHELNLGIQAFLRLFVYQTRISKRWSKPDINEAENIAALARSILGWKALQKVEPFLGIMLTQKPSVVYENQGDTETTGLLTFHPSWFVEYCFRVFGRRAALLILEANTGTPPVYVRLNEIKADRRKILESLREDGISLSKVEGLESAYEVLSTKHPLAKSASFKKGFFEVQDKSSCFAAEAACPKPNDKVLDVCAAPGAKTTYLAQLMRNVGTIYSVDYSRRRMKVWKKKIADMGVQIAEPVIADARCELPFATDVDLLVLDPPCTGTGVFWKMPSAKWRLTASSIERMAEIQWQMLNKCAKSLKTGGTLVYSTCSIALEENEMIIERFLRREPEYSVADIDPKMGSPGLRGLEKCQRLYPHVHRCNGFFIAKLVKNAG